MHRGPREAGDTFLVPQQLKIQRPKFCLVPADGAGREDCKEQTQEGGRRDDFGGQGVLASRGHWRLGSESHVGAHQTEKKKKKSIRVGNGLYDKYGGPETQRCFHWATQSAAKNHFASLPWPNKQMKTSLPYFSHFS